MSDLLFGTSGWSYKEWVGPFYDKTTRMFSHYARFFQTAEINSTFYRYPSKASIEGLNRTSPKDFVFSAKLPKLITHEKHLDPKLEIKNDLLRFLELLDPLVARNKLGCILIQLPPSFIYERDRENLEAFLEMLPKRYEFAAEFRNLSWLRKETWPILEKHNVAYCIVDEPLLPPEEHITADFAYFRWHGRGTRPWYDYHYNLRTLEEWVPRIEKTKDKVGKVYGYFNNHFHGYAVENCIEILEMLNATEPEHKSVKDKIIQHNKQKEPLAYETKLDMFSLPTQRTRVEDSLLKLTDENRLQRGMEIKAEELTIEASSEKQIKANIRDYTIELNLEERTLKHDCDDWRKGLETERICKHLVKFFTSIPIDDAIRILKDMTNNKRDWKFLSA